ncbi:hypothetical protein AK88_02724 [Plasmodium fragile]|uniref:Plasmodium RESA N-terminal domain-containing protein n=1 Tax=Plasmodium fragile TaxID=5857 RepID=A0A0D9QKQ6_PLAFR|nr:uncharacterized protein AK88_02724 [Plasmodium fragile]KJP87558.1 hypothetical protein AK88_02724 [Plasmodium fragile]
MMEFIFKLKIKNEVFQNKMNVFPFSGMDVSQTQISNRYLSHLCKNNNCRYNALKNKNDQTNSIASKVNSCCGRQNKCIGMYCDTNKDKNAPVTMNSVDVAIMRKKCFKEHRHLTEEELYHLVNTLERVPYKCDMNSIWWQLRYIEACKFDNIEERLSKHLNVLAKKYKADDAFLEDKLEYYSYIIYRRKKEHEVFYNMRFYALLDRESFELKEFIDIINESRDAISKFGNELMSTSESLFKEKGKERNVIIEKIMNSYFGND